MPAKAKVRAKGRSEERRGFFWTLTRTPWRQIILVAAFLALFWWQRDNLEEAWDAIWRAVGWGLAIILIALVTVTFFARLYGYRQFLRHWNRWVAGAAFAFAAWGVLAFLGVGGAFGDLVIRDRGLLGVSRLFGILILGIIFVAPAFSADALARFFAWANHRLAKKKAESKPARQTSQTTPAAAPTQPTAVFIEPPEREVEAKREKPPRKAETEPAPAQPKDVRQVAQEVWKKYGQAPNLTVVDGWRLPPIEIIDRSPEVEFSQADNNRRAKLIEEALASYGVEGKVVQINTGPTVTQFGIEPGWDRKFKEVKEKDSDGNVVTHQEEVSKTRVKVERITSLANNMALALAAQSIRIEAPVPGKSVVGIEVPNTVSSVVSLRGVVETSTFQKLLGKSKLTVALGKGAGGEAIAADLTKMPHLLIAGATGSGKTVCLNTIIACFLLHNTPNDVRFIMVDPKRVELTPYNSIPHLSTPVIVDATKALAALRWLQQEMDQRYQKLAAAGARNIEGFNKTRQGADRMPFIVLVIDELADLMMTGYDEVETILCRLAQLARAVGIHLVVATQRPSVDVITGLIKANFPTRISFAVTSQVDSRTILDTVGAEKLLGRGDMLFMPTEAAKPKRLQGCFVSDPEVERLVYFWGSQRKEADKDLKLADLDLTATPAAGPGGQSGDPMLEAARELAKQHEHLSASFLQRRLRIGYPRAARIMEILDEEANAKQEPPMGSSPPPQAPGFPPSRQ